MSKIVDAVNRMLGRSVRDLAGEVDEALGRLAQARGLEAAATDALRLAQQDVAKATAEVNAARDALFTEHPDLRPAGWSPYADFQEQPMQTQPVPQEGQPELDPSKFESEPIEIDDSDDPRFTAGAVSVPVSDDAPLPPIVWGEHDDV